MSSVGLLTRWTVRLTRIGVHAAFPLRCWQCDSLYAPLEKDLGAVEAAAPSSFGWLMNAFVCPHCASGYAPVRPPLCHACGQPYRTDQGIDHLCADCLSNPMTYTTARAAGLYAPPLKTLIHQFKYQGRCELARPLGRLLWDALMRFYDPQQIDLIVPVPLHWFRLFRRGFNQAALLVRDWRQFAADAGMPWKPRVITHHLMNRRRRTPAQTGLGKRQRRANLKDAFVVPQTDSVNGKRVLLVDDVLTTGATAVECTKALKSAGADTVQVLTLARAV